MEGPRVEPDLATDASLLDVLAELRQREPIFHRRAHLSSGEDFERQAAADFWEVGGAGRRYSREFVWSVLSARLASGRTTSASAEAGRRPNSGSGGSPGIPIC
jgi:hypothetical protein